MHVNSVQLLGAHTALGGLMGFPRLWAPYASLAGFAPIALESHGLRHRRVHAASEFYLALRALWNHRVASRVLCLIGGHAPLSLHVGSHPFMLLLACTSCFAGILHGMGSYPRGCWRRSPQFLVKRMRHLRLGAPSDSDRITHPLVPCGVSPFRGSTRYGSHGGC